MVVTHFPEKNYGRGETLLFRLVDQIQSPQWRVGFKLMRMGGQKRMGHVFPFYKQNAARADPVLWWGFFVCE